MLHTMSPNLHTLLNYFLYCTCIMIAWDELNQCVCVTDIRQPGSDGRPHVTMTYQGWWQLGIDGGLAAVSGSSEKLYTVAKSFVTVADSGKDCGGRQSVMLFHEWQNSTANAGLQKAYLSQRHRSASYKFTKLAKIKSHAIMYVFPLRSLCPFSHLDLTFRVTTHNEPVRFCSCRNNVFYYSVR